AGVGVGVGVPTSYGYTAPPVFTESWVPQTYEPIHPQAEYSEYVEYSDPLFGPMPTTLPDGRPLFRDEVPWSGI
ncbi:hypothetical protein, partial [Streptomyces sp. MBT65]|uniref:hypothetical protein n=1 Tax=Streptomyces sp. MBT65 TaxID=1488395 RepID=UPI001F3C9AB4